tara:strand:- start:3185 stop:3595 length:411 start_codon:yes stop_codon:yes gene_type:complete
MARQFPVNIEIYAGTDFSKKFYMKNQDLTPTDITGYTFESRLAKHSTSQDAVATTSTSPVWRYVDFVVTITDATNGEYTLSLPADTTSKLKEGKYVYNIVSTPDGGVRSDNVNGLVFVIIAFAYTGTNGSLDPNYP